MRHIYLAGQEGEEFRQICKSVGNKNYLMSYYYLKNTALKDMFSGWDFKPNVFLDSGGFTARTKEGVNINNDEYLKGYIEFIKANNEWITTYANFDLDKTNDSQRNQKIMEEAGLKPLPVYHADEQLTTLRYYAKKYEYVAIGGIAGQKMDTDSMYKFLKKVNNIVKGEGGKIHAFGVTVPWILNRLEIHSCDSTSWLMGGKYGNCYYLRRGKLEGGHHKEKIFHRYRGAMDKIGISYNDFKDGDYKALNKWNAYMWVSFNNRLNEGGGEEKKDTNVSTTGNRVSTIIDIGQDSTEEIKPITLIDLNESLNAPNDTKEELSVEEVKTEEPMDMNPSGLEDEEDKTMASATRGYGNIHKTLASDPAIEKKREEKNKEAMIGNTHHYITGQYSLRTPPALCSMDCFISEKCPHKDFGKICSVDERTGAIVKLIHSRNPESVIHYLNSLNQMDIKRHFKNAFFETVEGGELDKQVTALGITITERSKLLLEIERAFLSSGGGINIEKSQVQIINLSDGQLQKVAQRLIDEGAFKGIEHDTGQAGLFDRGNTVVGANKEDGTRP